MKKIILLSVIALVVLIGCENPFWSNGANKQPIIENTPIKYTYDDEAVLMAMSYYKLFTAPDSISQRIYDDIALIDSQFNDTLNNWYKNSEQNNGLSRLASSEFIKFTPHWFPSYIGFTFESATVGPILDSTQEQFYNILDSLGAKSFNIFYVTPNSTPYGSLYLSGLKNPTVALSAFNDIPEIKNVYATTSPGDQSNIFPYFEDENRKYFYMFRWGDCPSGCIYSSTYYFMMDSDSAILVAKYNTATDTIPRPPWTDTVKTAFEMWNYLE